MIKTIKLLLVLVTLLILFVFLTDKGKLLAQSSYIQWQLISSDFDRPSDADLNAYKAFHHTRYLEQTALQAGGTNKLLHSDKLPTEGKDHVVTPSLDLLYSKAVIDLSSGPVLLTMPNLEEKRYWSIHVTDQEHYTIFDEIRPTGKYLFVRQGHDVTASGDTTIISSRGNYPHLFIRIHVPTESDIPNVKIIQNKIQLSGTSKPLKIDNFIEFTVNSHSEHPQNEGLLEQALEFSQSDYDRVTLWLKKRVVNILNNIGAFGAIDSTEPGSQDRARRAVGMFGHLGLPLHHAFYTATIMNCDGLLLNGGRTEVLQFPYYPEGVKEFWSITRYSLLTRNTIPGKNDMFNAYNTQPDKDGLITITFSHKDPKDGTYWMPVNKDEPYYYIGRYYQPDNNNLPTNMCNEQHLANNTGQI